MKTINYPEGVEMGSDGERYEGEYCDCIPHGKGVLTMPDGERLDLEGSAS